ncbi:MAG: hypothetical protein ACR2LN_06625 [Candidatus Levyibacteriota bacterium]
MADQRKQDNLDLTTRSQAGSASAAKQDMSKLGKKGGKAAQESGSTHDLTQKERSLGGQNSSRTDDKDEM